MMVRERWTTWSFTMKAYCAAMAPRLGDLMGTASTQDVEIRQDAVTPSDARTQHESVLHPELVDGCSGTGHRAKQPSEQWTGGVAVECGSLGTESTIQVPRNAASDPVSKMGHSGSDVTQLLTTWEKQVQDYEQQSGDKISDAIKLGVVLHSLARDLFA